MKKALLIAISAFFLTVGVTEAQVVIRVGPPPLRHEVIPPHPYAHPDWAWRAGYYRWDSRRYVWVPGVYVAPPYRGGRWVPGHYRATPGGYIWVEGHWR